MMSMCKKLNERIKHHKNQAHNLTSWLSEWFRDRRSSEGVKFEIRTPKVQFEQFSILLTLKIFLKIGVGAALEGWEETITSFFIYMRPYLKTS